MSLALYQVCATCKSNVPGNLTSLALMVNLLTCASTRLNLSRNEVIKRCNVHSLKNILM